MGALEQAQAMADARFNPQKAAIEARIGLTNNTTDARNRSVNTMGEQGRANIGGVYDTLQGLLGANKTSAMGSINTTADQIGQGYRDAQQIGTSARNQSRDALAQLAQSMNLGSYTMPVIGGLEAESNQMIQRNADRDATVTGNLRNWGAQAGSIYDQQIGTGHQMRASALSDFESELIRSITENNLSGSEQVSDLNDRLAEMLGERGGYLAEQVNNLSAQEFEQAFKQAQIDMEREQMAQQASQAQAELSLRAQGMADDRDARAQAGQMSEKEKLAMQLEAWGMQQDQSNTDRNFGLESAKLQMAGRPDQLGTFNALQNSRGRNPDTGELGPVDQGTLSSMYDLGLLERPPPSRKKWGIGASSRGNPLSSSKGSLAELRALRASLGR